MVDSIPRPIVSPERYRELEVIAMQIMLMAPTQDLGECLIVRDICTNILKRWLADERLPAHDPVHLALAGGDGAQIIRLRPAE